MKYIINIINLIIVVNLISCGKTETKDCPQEFILPSAQFLPFDSIYNIGDTISIVSKFYKNLTEKTFGKTYSMDNIIFTGALGVFKIDTSTFSGYTNLNTSKYINIISCTDTNYSWYTYSTGETSIDFTYPLIKDSFNITINITPKRAGVFIIAFGGGQHNSNQYFKGKCDDIDFDAYFFLNEGTDNNISLLKQSPLEHYNTWILQNPHDRFYKKRYFAYKVIK